jgi:hypothetical protein
VEEGGTGPVQETKHFPRVKRSESREIKEEKKKKGEMST